MNPVTLALVAVQTLLPISAAWAEMAIIQGKVTDAQGNPIAGYPVILENQASASQGWSENIGFTSENGDFLISVDKPGQYVAKLPNSPAAATEFEVSPDLLLKSEKSPETTKDIGNISLP